MLKLVSFDMDGTILDTVGDIAAALNRALEANGLPARPEKEIRMGMGGGGAIMLRMALPPSLRDDNILHAKVMETYADLISGAFNVKTKPYEGILDLIKELRANGVYTAIISNKNDFFVKELTSIYFPGLFEEACGCSDEIPLKPDPTVLLRLMERYGASREETLHIGDGDHDIHFAENAGVRCVSVTWGYRTADQLKSAGATVLIDEVSQLRKFLLDK